MSHSPVLLKGLGKIVAAINKQNHAESLDQYEKTLLEALHLKATSRKHTNVLHHIMGYFKKHLSMDEKAELIEVIERYRQNLIPLVVPLVLLQHYVRKYQEPYLLKQWYLHPHPDELKLRNHV